MPRRPPGALLDPGLVERARAAREALGEKVFVLGHHYQRDEVIAFADVTGDSFKLAKEASLNESPVTSAKAMTSSRW